MCFRMVSTSRLRTAVCTLEGRHTTWFLSISPSGTEGPSDTDGSLHLTSRAWKMQWVSAQARPSRRRAPGGSEVRGLAAQLGRGARAVERQARRRRRGRRRRSFKVQPTQKSKPRGVCPLRSPFAKTVLQTQDATKAR